MPFIPLVLAADVGVGHYMLIRVFQYSVALPEDALPGTHMRVKVIDHGEKWRDAPKSWSIRGRQFTHLRVKVPSGALIRPTFHDILCEAVGKYA